MSPPGPGRNRTGWIDRREKSSIANQATQERVKMGKIIEIKCQGAGTLDISKVEPFQGNLKSLSKENYERLKKSILDLGFSFPLHIWRHEGHHYCVDGHQRERVLQQMGKEGYLIPPIPVVYVEAKDKREAKLKILAATSQFGAIEPDGLYQFMSESEITMPELETSFSFPEINFDRFNDEFFTDPATDDDDAVPEVTKTDIKLGDMFALGDHRLLAGDATKAEDVAKLMGKEKADMVFTDPPYGVDYEGKTKKKLKIKNDETTGIFTLAIKNFITKPGATFYVCCPAGNNFKDFLLAFETRCKVSSTLIWVKNSMVLGHGDYHYQHEPILYGWDNTGTHKYYGDRTQTTVWNINRPSRSEEHPTMKPVELCEKAILNSSVQGWVVLDLFGGSGSTLIACEKTKRRCFMSEIDPMYCQVIINRWQEFTGKKAVKL